MERRDLRPAALRGSPLLSPKTRPDLHWLFSEAPGFLPLRPLPPKQLQSPHPGGGSAWPRAQAPGPLGWTSCSCLSHSDNRALWPGTPHCVSAPHTRPSPCQPPPPPRASWRGTTGSHGAGGGHRVRVAACRWRRRSAGSRPWCQPHPHPPCHRAPPPRNCSNRPRLPPHCYSNSRAGAAGRREACLAGGRPEGHLVTGRQCRLGPTWAPHQRPARWLNPSPLRLAGCPHGVAGAWVPTLGLSHLLLCQGENRGDLNGAA